MTFVFFILRVRAVLLIKSETISSQSEAFMTMELVSEAPPPHTHTPHLRHRKVEIHRGAEMPNCRPSARCLDYS